MKALHKRRNSHAAHLCYLNINLNKHNLHIFFAPCKSTKYALCFMLYELSSQLIRHFRLSTIVYANAGLSSARFASRDRGIGSDRMKAIRCQRLYATFARGLKI